MNLSEKELRMFLAITLRMSKTQLSKSVQTVSSKTSAAANPKLDGATSKSDKKRAA